MRPIDNNTSPENRIHSDHRLQRQNAMLRRRYQPTERHHLNNEDNQRSQSTNSNQNRVILQRFPRNYPVGFTSNVHTSSETSRMNSNDSTTDNALGLSPPQGRRMIQRMNPYRARLLDNRLTPTRSDNESNSIREQIYYTNSFESPEASFSQNNPFSQSQGFLPQNLESRATEPVGSPWEVNRFGGVERLRSLWAIDPDVDEAIDLETEREAERIISAFGTNYSDANEAELNELVISMLSRSEHRRRPLTPENFTFDQPFFNETLRLDMHDPRDINLNTRILSPTRIRNRNSDFTYGSLSLSELDKLTSAKDKDGLVEKILNKPPTITLDHTEFIPSFLKPGQTFKGTQNQIHPCGRAVLGEVDHWQVKVVIHSIDLKNGTIVGLMEALNTPMRCREVVTFWEGEIIDFKNHGLWTSKWGATRDTDIQHWSRMNSFKRLREAFSNEQDYNEVYNQFIFMRWKEKFFINDQSRGLGLTIAGFYYISIRRSDGFIEGFYYDPVTKPFQRLELYPLTQKGGHKFEEYTFC